MICVPYPDGEARERGRGGAGGSVADVSLNQQTWQGAESEGENSGGDGGSWMEDAVVVGHQGGEAGGGEPPRLSVYCRGVLDRVKYKVR